MKKKSKTDICNISKILAVLVLCISCSILKSCKTIQCDLSKSDLQYVYPESISVIFLENNIDTLEISPQVIYDKSMTSTAFFPNIDADEIVLSYFDLESINMYVGISRVACTNHARIKISVKDNNEFDKNIYDTAYISNEITIIDKTYPKYWHFENDDTTSVVKDLLYTIDYGLLRLELEDGYTLELIEIKEED